VYLLLPLIHSCSADAGASTATDSPVPNEMSTNQPEMKAAETPGSGVDHVHTISLVPHVHHLHKVHKISVLAKGADKSLSESAKEVVRTHLSGKCSCDVMLIGEKRTIKNRVHVHDVYVNKVMIEKCDSQEQQNCRDFCVQQVSQPQFAS
jgi:hypothetical protein